MGWFVATIMAAGTATIAVLLSRVERVRISSADDSRAPGPDASASGTAGRADDRHVA